MIPTMTIRRAAAIWSLSERRVNELCKTGRIKGAYKENRQWQIPVNAKKPVDERFKIKLPPSQNQERMPLPVGITDYKKVASMYYYIDKTLMIKEILDEKSQISLFTRPRGFGKSLTMDMLKTFFEMSSEDTTVYFRDKKIWEAGESYRSYQGKYPVIYLDFRSVKYATWDNSYARIAQLIANEYARHRDILESDRCSAVDKACFQRVLQAEATPEELKDAVLNLTRILDDVYQVPPVVIIDEYDTPYTAAYTYGYYDTAKDFFDALIYDGLVENRHLSFAFIAGILTFTHQGVKVNSVLDSRYGEFFGFTNEEVLDMLDDYNAAEKVAELRGWYSAYHFGNTDIYNPWSVLNYFNDECRLLPFWEMTGDNSVIDMLLQDSSLDMLENLEIMMQQKEISARIDLDVIDPRSGDGDQCSLYSYMLETGYFKATRADKQFDGDYMCDITIPNRELTFIFGKKILAQFESIIPRETSLAVREAIYRIDVEALRNHIYELIQHTISFNSRESDKIFYHGLVLGLCAMLGNRYYVSADHDSDSGSFSIEMMPLEFRLPGILIQTKQSNIGNSQQLDALARFAVKQIANRQFETEAKSRYVRTALKYGVAYNGNTVSIVTE